MTEVLVSDETLKRIAVLSGARNPSPELQGDYDTTSTIELPEEGEQAGVSVEGYLAALIQVDLRRDLKTHTAVVEVLSAVSGEDYEIEISIGGAVSSTNTYTAGAGDTVTDIATELVNEITANDSSVSATSVGGVVTITGDDPDTEYTLDMSGSTTPANLDETWHDATEVILDVYARMANQTSGEERFALVPGLEAISLNYKGFVDRAVCAGQEYLFVHPTSWDGNFKIRIAPCVLEG
jgi:hypothetical protein